MRFVLPESRPNQDEQLHGVKFENGVAELSDEHGRALKPLLCGYYGCTVEGEESESSSEPEAPESAEVVAAKLAALSYPELQSIAKEAGIAPMQKREKLEEEIAAAVAAGTVKLPAASE